MRLRYFLMAGWCAMAACGGISLAADFSVDDVLHKYRQQLKEAHARQKDSGEKPSIDFGQVADNALAGVDLQLLTPAQVSNLIDQLPALAVSQARVELIAIADQRRQSIDSTGADWELIRLKLARNHQGNSDRLEQLQDALQHPAISEASVAIDEIFAAALEQDAGTFAALQPQMRAFADTVNLSHAADGTFGPITRFILVLPDRVGNDGAAVFNDFRQRWIGIIDRRIAEIDNSKRSEKLQVERSLLTGAYARGELIGHPAPAIEFAYFFDPAEPSRTANSLEDFKGKVIVLDFWATWCGPCIAGFPEIQALQQHYKGFDVQILGVTSLQGFFPSGWKRIDLSGDADQELALSREFALERDVSWPIVFSNRSVFDPEYGIFSIPHLTIIDTRGTVRFYNIPSRGSIVEKTALIDGLLAEGNLPVPAVPIVEPNP